MWCGFVFTSFWNQKSWAPPPASPTGSQTVRTLVSTLPLILLTGAAPQISGSRVGLRGSQQRGTSVCPSFCVPPRCHCGPPGCDCFCGGRDVETESPEHGLPRLCYRRHLPSLSHRSLRGGWAPVLPEVVSWIAGESRSLRGVSGGASQEVSLKIAQRISCTSQGKRASHLETCTGTGYRARVSLAIRFLLLVGRFGVVLLWLVVVPWCTVSFLSFSVWGGGVSLHGDLFHCL